MTAATVTPIDAPAKARRISKQVRNEERLETALSGFLGHLDACSLSDNTKKAYRRQGGVLADWLRENLGRHPDAFKDDVGAEGALAGWKREMIARGLSAQSVNQALAAGELLYLRGANIQAHIKRIRLDQPGEPEALTQDQEAALKRAAARNRKKDRFWGARDEAIIWMFLETGARCEEMQKLLVNDAPVSQRAGKVKLRGKGDQIRINPIPAATRKRISDWLVIRSTREVADGKPYLWVNQTGEQMGYEAIVKLVIRVGLQAGIDGLRPHKLRHTFATNCNRAGMPLPVLQKLMGHAKLETTARYVRAGEAEVALEIERVFGGDDEWDD